LRILKSPYIAFLNSHVPTFQPTKGGLHLIDTKSGSITRTLIGHVAEGVSDVKAIFSPTGEHVLYYHRGQQTLRAFRVCDGRLLGTFRPHAHVQTWAFDPSGERVVIGHVDGSLLTAVLHDEARLAGVKTGTLALLPSRKHLALHLGLDEEELQRRWREDERGLELAELGVIAKAVAKFRRPLQRKRRSGVVGAGAAGEGTTVCSLQ